MSRVVATALAAGAGVLIGTALHEGVHWAAVRLLGGRVVNVRLVPPRPHVDYDDLSPRRDAAVKAATVVTAPLVVALALLAAVDVGLSPLTWVLLATAVAYLPRSETDWDGFRRLVGRA